MSPNSRTVHGVLIRINNCGVLLTGPSGIGKSDCALDLISRGHSLVADDVVEFEVRDNCLIGRPPERFAGLLAIAGLGVIDVSEVFGQSAFEKESRLDLCLRLVDGGGIEPLETVAVCDILGLSIPEFQIPSAKTRNLWLLVETAVRLLENSSGATVIRLIETHGQLVSVSAKF